MDKGSSRLKNAIRSRAFLMFMLCLGLLAVLTSIFATTIDSIDEAGSEVSWYVAIAILAVAALTFLCCAVLCPSRLNPIEEESSDQQLSHHRNSETVSGGRYNYGADLESELPSTERAGESSGVEPPSLEQSVPPSSPGSFDRSFSDPQIRWHRYRSCSPSEFFASLSASSTSSSSPRLGYGEYPGPHRPRNERLQRRRENRNSTDRISAPESENIQQSTGAAPLPAPVAENEFKKNLPCSTSTEPSVTESNSVELHKLSISPEPSPTASIENDVIQQSQPFIQTTVPLSDNENNSQCSRPCIPSSTSVPSLVTDDIFEHDPHSITLTSSTPQVAENNLERHQPSIASAVPESLSDGASDGVKDEEHASEGSTPLPSPQRDFVPQTSFSFASSRTPANDTLNSHSTSISPENFYGAEFAYRPFRIIDIPFYTGQSVAQSRAKQRFAAGLRSGYASNPYLQSEENSLRRWRGESLSASDALPDNGSPDPARISDVVVLQDVDESSTLPRGPNSEQDEELRAEHSDVEIQMQDEGEAETDVCLVLRFANRMWGAASSAVSRWLQPERIESRNSSVSSGTSVETSQPSELRIPPHSEREPGRQTLVDSPPERTSEDLNSPGLPSGSRTEVVRIDMAGSLQPDQEGEDVISPARRERQ